MAVVFECQVQKGELVNAIPRKTFRKGGSGRTSGERLAESYMEYLNNILGIKFAREDEGLEITIFIGESHLENG